MNPRCALTQSHAVGANKQMHSSAAAGALRSERHPGVGALVGRLPCKFRSSSWGTGRTLVAGIVLAVGGLLLSVASRWDSSGESSRR